MNAHDQAIRLAALSVTDALGPEEAGDLEAHLHSCVSCRRVGASLASDHRRLQTLLAPQPVSVRVRTAVLAEASARRGTSTWRLLLVAALLAALLGLLALAAGALAPRVPAGFAGTWTTTNCATWWEGPADAHAVDCDRWGDGSGLTLDIGTGERSSIRVTGGSTPACRGAGGPNPHPPLPSVGPFLLVEFVEVDCGDIGLGHDLAADLYLDPGSDTIWLDDDGDGWGLIWHRN